MQSRAWLLDASIYIFRAWFALPDRWHTAEGRPTNAVLGYAGFLLQLLPKLGDNAHLAAAFDESLGSCFRTRIFPDYKCSRVLPDEDLAFQLATCREVTEMLGLPCYGGPEFEADDYLATLARVNREAGHAVTLISRDKDLGQLLHAGDEIWDVAANQRVDLAAFTERFEVSPAQFVDFQALVGDRMDDIPGVPGVGPRSAAQLLRHFGNLNVLEEHLNQVAELPIRGARGLQQRLIAHWPQVRVSQQLARLECGVPGVQPLPRWRPQRERLLALGSRLSELGSGDRLPAQCEKLARELA